MIKQFGQINLMQFKKVLSEFSSILYKTTTPNLYWIGRGCFI